MVIVGLSMKPAETIHDRRPAPRGTRALAFALVAVQLAGFVHVATASHVLCAEHGEWVDARPDTVAAPRTSPAAEPEILADESPALAADHEHCAALFHRSGALPSVPRTDVVAVLSFSSVAAQPDHAAHLRPALTFAPKQSPPA
jgi:hypothetical protein